MSECGCLSHNGFLTERGYAELAERELEWPEAVDMSTRCLYLDKVGSVSGTRRDEDTIIFDDELLDQQYRRFHNGS